MLVKRWGIILKSHVGLEKPSYVVRMGPDKFGHTKIPRLAYTFETKAEALFAIDSIKGSGISDVYYTSKEVEFDDGK